jgi:hypothetical protein
MSYSRRSFLWGIGAATAMKGRAVAAESAGVEPFLAPRALVKLLHPSAPSKHPSGGKIGYASITWGKNVVQAVQEISSLGYTGVQTGDNIRQAFPDPQQARDFFAEQHTTFVGRRGSGSRSATEDVQRKQK